MRNSPPEAPELRTSRTILGQTLTDEYGWSRTEPPLAFRGHLEAEEAHFLSEIDQFAPLVDELNAELTTATTSSAARADASALQVGEWLYWQESIAFGESRVVRKPVVQGDDVEATAHVVIDDGAKTRSFAGYRRGTTDVSLDGAVIAYSERRSGRPGYDLQCGEPPDGYELALQGVASQFVLSPDGSTLFFLRMDSSGRTFQLWRRSVADPASERLLLSESDPTFRISASKSRCATMLIVTSRSRVDTSIYAAFFSDLLAGSGLVQVRPKGQGAVSSVEVIQTGTRTFIAYLERREGVDGIWVTAVKGEPFTGQLLKVRPNDVLVRMQVLKHGIALQTRQNGRSSTGHFSVEQVEKWIESSAIPLGWDDIAGASLAKLQRRLGDNPSWARPSYSVITSSLVSSPTSVDVRFADSAAADSTTTGAGPARYTEQRMEVPTRDGTLVPVYIARARQDTGLSAGAPPAVLRFYGAYGVVTDPVYSPATLALLDRGITVILIQPRGGGELGTEWWTSGRREHKERTITDVLDCAEFLASSGVVRAGRLALEAHSAGGLIAAAVLLRRPDLFCTAVLTNPFVDPVSALSDPALPLTASDWDEWGNPLSSTEELERLRSLSPYEGLPADCRALPPMLLVGSLDDMRVSIVEPAKFVARLRDRGATAVLHVRMHSDHTFAGTPAEGRNETAMLLAWICALTTRSREEEQ